MKQEPKIVVEWTYFDATLSRNVRWRIVKLDQQTIFENATDFDAMREPIWQRRAFCTGYARNTMPEVTMPIAAVQALILKVRTESTS
jgi:hypothetical protein